MKRCTAKVGHNKHCETRSESQSKGPAAGDGAIGGILQPAGCWAPLREAPQGAGCMKKDIPHRTTGRMQKREPGKGLIEVSPLRTNGVLSPGNEPVIDLANAAPRPGRVMLLPIRSGS